jgi:hypothetical protein
LATKAFRLPNICGCPSKNSRGPGFFSWVPYNSLHHGGKSGRGARKLLANDGLEADEALVAEIRLVIQQKFVDFALDG